MPHSPQALEGNQQVVTYEVVVSMQSVVSRVPLELCEPAWDVLLNILRAIVQQDSMLLLEVAPVLGGIIVVDRIIKIFFY